MRTHLFRDQNSLKTFLTLDYATLPMADRPLPPYTYTSTIELYWFGTEDERQKARMKVLVWLVFRICDDEDDPSVSSWRPINEAIVGLVLCLSACMFPSSYWKVANKIF